MRLRNLFIIIMMVSSLLFVTTYSIEAVDITITDKSGDVYSNDYLTGEWTIITDHPDIEVDNLDLIQATYTKQATQAIVSLQVKGNIENRGEFIDPDNPNMDINTVEYDIQLTTSRQYYSLAYCNQTGRLYVGDQQINLTSSDFSVVGNTLTIIFPLTNADEIYENLSVISTFLKGNFSEIPIEVFLVDIAPTPPLFAIAGAPYIGYEGENIQFNGYAEPLSGDPPYVYHWHFGDQSSSTQQNPTHTYTKAGDYTYTFTVTDSACATASVSYNITIKEVKKALLFGSFSFIYTGSDYIQVVTANLGMILFKPFQVIHYSDGQEIYFVNDYNGVIISDKFLIGMFNGFIYPDQTPDIACKKDALVDNTAILMLQRLLPETVYNSLSCH